MDASGEGRVTMSVGRGVHLAPGELRFAFHKCGGPGGQNVNKVNTRVTLYFDLAGSASLTSAQKVRIRRKLATRISRAGVLRVVSSKHRTQAANRRAATERFLTLLAEALHVPPVRRQTRLPSEAKRRRREEKRRRSIIKQQRRKRHHIED